MNFSSFYHHQNKDLSLLLLVVIILLPRHAIAADNTDRDVSEPERLDSFVYRIFQGFSISPGISIKSPTVGVTRKSDNYAGQITGSPGVLGFEFDIVLRDFDIPGTSLGVTLFSHAGTFITNKQFDDNPDDKTMKSIGTSISGWYSYVVPAIYYIRRQPDKVARLGGGLGYGAAQFSGDIELTSDGVLPAVTSPVRVSGFSSKAFAYMVFYDLRFDNRWTVRVAIGGLRFQDASYKNELDEFNVTVSRAFVLLP